MIASRLEALVVARAHTTTRARSVRDLVAPLARFAPGDRTATAWRDQLAEIAAALRGRGLLRDDLRPRDPDQLARMIGRVAAKTWPQLADRVLPGLGIGLTAEDPQLARLAGRDAWAAAIAGRALGVWTAGPPPSLGALCDEVAWDRLGLAGKPKRCPPEIRALFVQRELAPAAAVQPGPPERWVRLLAAREVGAPRPELRALLDALVRGWLAGRVIGEPAAAADPPPFATAVRSAATAARDGVFGDRKVFIAAVWHALRQGPTWSSLTLDEFKARLVAAQRTGELALARADLVAAMDPELVAASETTTDGASFHFIVREQAP